MLESHILKLTICLFVLVKQMTISNMVREKVYGKDHTKAVISYNISVIVMIKKGNLNDTLDHVPQDDCGSGEKK